jgi:hypothetical protein
VLKAYIDGSTIRDIMQAFSIPSSATGYKILKGKVDLEATIDL